MRSKDYPAWYLPLLLVFILSVSLLSCSQSPPSPPAPVQATGPVATWIQQHALPLTSVEPGGSAADLQPLQQIVGDAMIVGLGEATHGAHEFFSIKSRLFEFLVEKMGFTTFAIENGWDVSRQIDQYVQTGNGDIHALMRADLYQSWRTQEVLDLIEWMRTYNASPAHAAKVHFVGIDAWDVSQAVFDDVVTYVRAVDPQQADQVQALYFGIRPNTPGRVLVDYDCFSANSQDAKLHYQANAQQVYDLLQSQQSTYESRSSSQAFALALHEAEVILQYITLGVLIPPSGTLFSSSAAYDKRDEFMADNVAWLHDQAGGQGKMVVWAHNVHIGSLKVTKNMGAFLRRWYQESYRLIGTSFYQGKDTIFQGESTIFQTPTPGTDTYNYALGSVGLPLYLLSLRDVPTGPVNAWIQGPHPLLNYGVGGEDLEMLGSLQYWFDAIAQIETITPSHVLP